MKYDPDFFKRGLLGAALMLLGAHADANADAQGTAAKAWQKVGNLPAVVGLDGQRHSATCSGYPGTDKAFSFWARRTGSKNTVVYFEGGGACWDDLTCTFPMSPAVPPQVPQFFMPAIPADTDPATFDGIFKTDNPANPMRGWNMVYIPYCTGDLHTGSATKQYVNVGHPVLPLPSTFPIEHRGFDNFMVVLDWMKKNIDAPRKVVVAGSSAGGYGATANFPWVRRAWPQARTYVIADASQGVTTPAFDTGDPGRNSWNMQLAPWVFGTNPSLIAGPEIMRVAAQGQPRARVAQFTTTMDAVQIAFYGVMKQFYGPGGSCPNPAVDWTQQMTATLQSYTTDTPNFRYYLAAGDYHTLLRSPQFYSETSPGISFNTWTANMLASGSAGSGSGSWDNEACDTCLLPLPCP